MLTITHFWFLPLDSEGIDTSRAHYMFTGVVGITIDSWAHKNALSFLNTFSTTTTLKIIFLSIC